MTQATTGAPAAAATATTRFSQSVLWQLQRAFYSREGVSAWSSGKLPSYVTTNPYIANAYAKVVLGWLRDCWAAGAIDPHHPVYIVELGSGPGRFAYLFMKALLEMHGSSSLRRIRLCYVATDVSAANLDHLRSHPALQPFITRGDIQFLEFDAGTTAFPFRTANPVAVIANYVFDSLPQDLFYVRDGRLFETRVAVSLPDGAVASEPELLPRAALRFEQHPVSGAYYEHDASDRTLASYADAGELSFTFPCAALRAISGMEAASRDRLLLLSADKGWMRADQIPACQPPSIEIHGGACFSMMVNFDALARYFLERGGQAWRCSHGAELLAICAFASGGTDPYPETALAFDEAFNVTGPDDIYQLIRRVGETGPGASIHEILAYLRISRGDSYAFLSCFSALMSHAPDCTPEQKRELGHALRRVMDNHFPLTAADDIGQHAAAIAYEIGEYGAALDFLLRSIELNGNTPAVAFQVARCRYALGQKKDALDLIRDALERNPDFEAPLITFGFLKYPAARLLIQQIEWELSLA